MFSRFATFKYLALTLCSLLCSIALFACFSEANSNSVITENAVYPLDANIVSVLDYGAKGDGTTDDTDAIRQAVYENLTKHRTLFFPAGIYLVSDTIAWKEKDNLFGAFLTWQGEGIGNTVIKLKNNAPSFDDPQNPKPITLIGSLGTSGDGAGNRAHSNYIFDMTFNVGRGNPGAIGIDFNASNTGAIEHVAIVSEDGKGAVGLNLTREVGPCLIKHVSITGFDVGIQGGSALYSVTLENIQLENQNVVGIENRDLVLAIRKLSSINRVPALRNGGDWSGPIVIIDSDLRGGSSEAVAIESSNEIFVRNVNVEGYKAAIKSRDKEIKATKVEEFVSSPAINLFLSPSNSLNLPIEETPEFFEKDLNDWANVEAYGANREDNSDDSEGIQQAIDSGKTTIYFPWGYYDLNKPVIVRGNVRKIVGFHSFLRGKEGLLRFENNNHPVILERFNFEGVTLENASSQPVVVRHSLNPLFSTPSKTGTWFIENIVATPLNLSSGQKLYARQLNSEIPPPNPMIKNDGGLVWLLGYKTEQGNTVAATLNRGKTEILGGLFYPAQGVSDPYLPLLLNQNASVSAVYREITFGSTYTTQIKEIRQGKTKTLKRDVLGTGNMVAVPLYVGYEPREASDRASASQS